MPLSAGFAGELDLLGCRLAQSHHETVRVRRTSGCANRDLIGRVRLARYSHTRVEHFKFVEHRRDFAGGIR